MPNDQLDYLRQRWVSVVNDTDEYVPAYGAMRIIGVVPADSTDYPEEIGTFTIAKPNAANLVTGILFNGTFPLAPGSAGLGTMSFPTVLAYRTDDAHAVFEDNLGTENDSWYLLVGNRGFVASCVGTEIDTEFGYTVGERGSGPPAEDGECTEITVYRYECDEGDLIESASVITIDWEARCITQTTYT